VLGHGCLEGNSPAHGGTEWKCFGVAWGGVKEGSEPGATHKPEDDGVFAPTCKAEQCISTPNGRSAKRECVQVLVRQPAPPGSSLS
jgi:hypothetical protein